MTPRLATLAVALIVVTSCSGEGEDSSSFDGSVDPSNDAAAEVTTPSPSTTIAPDDTTTTTPGSQAGEGGLSLGPLGDTDVDLETDEGTVQIGEADIPTGLRADFPLPDDFEAELATETATDFGFSGTTAMPLDDLADLYETGLPAAGYTITDIETVEGVLVVYRFEAADQVGQVALTQSPGGDARNVLVAIGDGDDAAASD